MDNRKNVIYKIFPLYMSIMVILMIVALIQMTIDAPEEIYHYQVEYFRYYETGTALFKSNQQKLEVIYKTDSDTVKESFFVSNIKIGEKTEIVVRIQGHLKSVVLYMTKEDYESLLSKEVKE